ncbi:hypothetical protein TWF718_010037 [Orbilia javanica]|uniref:Uncharacterized protein n=1 Tax=Orbilia javanica TaxID=47235 RepID=A0AAN8MNR6_9PEZI
MYGFRYTFLMVALITFVSFVTARTVITIKTCSPRYCDHPVPNGKVRSATTTIHKETPYMITKLKTVTKPKYTRTITGTTTTTRQRVSTVSTVTIIKTIWTGTSTHTRKFIVTSPSSTETLPTTTTTISSTRTIAAPSGFVGVNDDPDNKAARDIPGRGIKRDSSDELDRRNANPEPAIAKAKYVTAVICTKTLLTKTGTRVTWKPYTKSTGTTTKTLFLITQTFWPDITTITVKGAKTLYTTISSYKVVFDSSTSTVSLGVATTYLSTVSSHLPVETFHAACGPRNQGPRPDQRANVGWAAYQAGPDPDEGVIQFQSDGTAYDCCVACHTYSQGGTCIGSLWRSNIWGGDSGCLGWLDDCDWEPPTLPEFSSTCNLVIAASNAPGLCRRHGFNYYSITTENEAAVSNGLGCRRYKFGKWFI